MFGKHNKLKEEDKSNQNFEQSKEEGIIKIKRETENFHPIGSIRKLKEELKEELKNKLKEEIKDVKSKITLETSQENKENLCKLLINKKLRLLKLYEGKLKEEGSLDEEDMIILAPRKDLEAYGRIKELVKIIRDLEQELKVTNNDKLKSEIDTNLKELILIYEESFKSEGLINENDKFILLRNVEEAHVLYFTKDEFKSLVEEGRGINDTEDTKEENYQMQMVLKELDSVHTNSVCLMRDSDITQSIVNRIKDKLIAVSSDLDKLAVVNILTLILNMIILFTLLFKK